MTPLRLIRELERLAYADARDVVQWDRKPQLDDQGNVVGFIDEMNVTPSHLLTKDAAAQIRSITTKSGMLKVEVHDKLTALRDLAKVLGLLQDAAPPPPSNVTVNQVNIGDNALEAARRLAFALEKAAQAAPLLTVDHALDAERKE